MKNKSIQYFFIILALSLSCITIKGMDDFRKGFRKELGKGIAKGLTQKNDKSFLDCLFDYFWIQFLLTPSTSSVDNNENKSHEELVDFRTRARFLTKLVKINDTYNFIRQKKHIQENSEIELEGLRQYQNYLREQANFPHNKSFKKIAIDSLFCGGITTILGISSYYFFKFGFNSYETDFKLVGAGTIFGLSTILSGFFTKERIEKHLPSCITNRKNNKIEDVKIAIIWATEIRDHLDNTDLILSK